MKRSGAIIPAIALLLALCYSPTVFADPLRYNWKDGQGYAYAVKIKVHGRAYTEDMEGTSVFTPRTVEDSATMMAYGILVPMRKDLNGNLLDRTGPLTLGPFRLELPNPGIAIPLGPQGGDFYGRDSQPPDFALGSVTRMIIQPLPPQDRKSWQVEDDCVLVSPADPVDDSTQKVLPAHEKFVYTITGRKGDLITIQVHYELQTKPGSAQGPKVEITGDGPLRFDRREGVPESLDFRASLKDTTGPEINQWTIQYGVRALHGVELEMALRPSGAGLEGTTILHAPELTQALADLHSSERWSRLEGANLLAAAEPVTRRSEVTQSLQSLLRDPDPFVRRAAVRALGKWGTAENVPALLPLLDSSNFALRWATIETLALIGDPQAAAPLARRVANPVDRSEAADALEALGPPATEATAALLTHRDWRVRVEACHILGSIGGPGAQRALRTATRDSNELVAAAAQNGLEEIAGGQ